MVIHQPALGTPQPAAHEAAPGRRTRIRASTLAIGVSIAVHAVVGLYLYNAAFSTPLSAPPDDNPIVIGDIFHPTPPPPKPRPKAPPNNLHRSTVTLLTPKDSFPVDPPKEPLIAETSKSNPMSTTEEAVQGARIEPPRERRISNPDWLSKPDARAMSDLFPRRAAEQDISGAATISCVVSASGSVGQCTVVKESPRDFGFGAAALKLAKYFKMRPRTEDDQPVDGAIVQIPIKFQLAAG